MQMIGGTIIAFNKIITWNFVKIGLKCNVEKVRL